MRSAIQTSAAAEPKGPYSQGIVASGRTLYVAGQAPIDPASGNFITESFEQQAELAFNNLKAIIEAAGGKLADTVKVNVYLRRSSDFQAMNTVYRRFFTEPYPARTTIQAEFTSFDIEVDCIVALDD